MNIKELNKIIQNHSHWLREDCDEWQNMKANLRGADLRRVDLRRVDLRGVDLRGAYLFETDLGGVNLRRAYLYKTDLRGANLMGADLNEANLSGAEKYFPICCPDHGQFIGFKKANEYIVKLQIPEDAKRSSSFGRKCRCNKAIVLDIENVDGTSSGLKEICSDYDNNFVYIIGKTVEVTDFDEDRWHECAPGIHFFITRQEAVEYPQ